MKRARNNEAVRKCRVKNKLQSLEREQTLQRLQAGAESFHHSYIFIYLFLDPTTREKNEIKEYFCMAWAHGSAS